MKKTRVIHESEEMDKYLDDTQTLYHRYGMPVPVTKSSILIGILLVAIAITVAVFVG